MELEFEQPGLLRGRFVIGSKGVTERLTVNVWIEFELFVNECKGAINPFCVKVEIIKPKLENDEMYPESIEIRRIKDKAEEEKDYARIEGYQKCEKRYFERFYEVVDRVDKLEQKIKNPKFNLKIF